MNREPAMRPWIGAIVVGAIISWAPADSASLSVSSRISATGVGAIMFGVTPAQARATGEKFDNTAPVRGSTCFYMRPRALPGLAFLVEGGTIRRAEVSKATIGTTDDIRIGDSASKVLKLYGGRAHSSTDKYDPHARVIIVDNKSASDAKRKMVFKVNAGKVRSIYAGLVPQINYVEGCA